jgi:hypothetical protein
MHDPPKELKIIKIIWLMQALLSYMGVVDIIWQRLTQGRKYSTNQS